MSDHSSFTNQLGLCLIVTFVICLAGISAHSQDKKDPRKTAEPDDVLKVSSTWSTST